MSIFNVIQPDQVIIKSVTDYDGIFEFSPLEPGFGITLGNSLRRVLLSSLEGFAITSIKIEGVEHEFTTIKGVVEDVTDIVLNCKKIRFKKKVEGIQNEVVHVSIKEKEKIIAGDFGRFLSGFQILNKELVICNKEKSTPFNITFVIERGKGYKPAEENKDIVQIGAIAIDAIYTPIKNVQYKVENYRVEQITFYDKLILEIKTDGSIHPRDALTNAAIILIKHLKIFKNERFMSFDVDEKNNNEYYYENNFPILGSYLSDLYLSIMAKNCLKSYKMITLGKLVSKQENDLKKVKHFCIKTMVAMNAFLTAQKIYFGLDISK
ncbi:DNA-directed RNA polymerase subunit alpha [Candidatus Uzinura diaspidicola str. ASNER]|uniref:DNA-directed RNA polymerase subunit alpha n=1 Tax=Candidatus Uzinura diaspidicola str. ASNER TaxID=1133592 RepID=L7VKB6_9FLAO|nr:DNA-directed RNA polymerase subunit alpha [Candidatus Uzinura diaspidicola str. ASNER]